MNGDRIVSWWVKSVEQQQHKGRELFIKAVSHLNFRLLPYFQSSVMQPVDTPLNVSDDSVLLLNHLFLPLRQAPITD